MRAAAPASSLFRSLVICGRAEPTTFHCPFTFWTARCVVVDHISQEEFLNKFA